MKTMCPLYTWAGDERTYRLRSAAIEPGGIAIVVSGNSGPMPYDPELRDHVAHLQQRGVLVLGYVRCTYGARPLGEVLEDITDWRIEYGVRRIFLDEWSHVGHAHLGLMWGAVRWRVREADRNAGPYLIANTGVPVSWPSVPDGTLVVTHEGNTIPGWAPKPWEAAIVHSYFDPAGARTVLGASGWQWGWCTADRDSNPYDGVESTIL